MISILSYIIFLITLSFSEVENHQVNKNLMVGVRSIEKEFTSSIIRCKYLGNAIFSVCIGSVYYDLHFGLSKWIYLFLYCSFI